MKLFLLMLFPIFVFSQEVKPVKNIMQVLWGKAPETGISFLPAGAHTNGGLLKYKDFYGVYYTGFNYKSIELSVFVNSYRDWTTALIYKREISITKKISINYGGGIMYGYKGKLQYVSGIPAKKEIFSGAINPVLGGGASYRLSKKWSIAVLIAPLINVAGVKYDL